MAKVWLGSYSVHKPKIRSGWRFNLFKMVKQGTGEVLCCRKH